MENKKQLVIIPPMSDALKKLNDVLEGVSNEENIEISIIDDLKELSQFLGSTGQCLILASSAKKCATFLQDNKAMLAKFHCKTILFTPKEIPAKTLIKFTKVGLTESILESSPPKTFLYKVKLLLRSIKTAKPQDEADKTIKSLEAMRALAEEFEKDSKEKPSMDEYTSFEMPDKKLMAESGEAIDYGGNLKGKSKHQEEAIDTNWKSDKKKTSLDLISEEPKEEDKDNADDEASSIDMYYRGKQKKNIELFADSDDSNSIEKISLENNIELDIPKRKSSYADVIDEGSIKQKRLDAESIEEELSKKNKSNSVELNLEASKSKTRQDLEDKASAELLYTDSSIDSIEEMKKRKNQIDLELDGSRKGKILNEEEQPSKQEDLIDEVGYDNSEVERNKKKKDTNLNLAAADDEISPVEDQTKTGIDPTSEEAEKLNSNMIGKEGSVDNIQTMIITKTKKVNTQEEAQEERKRKEDTNSLAAVPEEHASTDMDNPLGLGFTDDESQDSPLQPDAEKEDEYKKSSSVELDLEAADKKNGQSTAANEGINKDLAELAADDASNKKKNESTVKTDEQELNLRSLKTDGQSEAKEKNMMTDGQVEKIDTYYRSGDSKKSDHDWDNLNKKSNTLKLDILKTAREADKTEARTQKDLGEITIDYRKLKEEFDLMSDGTHASGSFDTHNQSESAAKNYDDTGSFKVIDINPRSLDFSINVVSAIYDKDIKAKSIFAMISLELVKNYHCIPVFYTYKLSDKKFTEVHNAFLETKDEVLVSNTLIEWWLEFKKDTALFDLFQSKSMTTWRCPEVIKDGQPWEDVELPTWADQELKNKRVELIFPYFDGIDRMGMAIITLPDGVDPKMANGLLTMLEMARTLFLDTIQRYQVQSTSPLLEGPAEAAQAEKKGVLNFFGGLFGKKKAG